MPINMDFYIHTSMKIMLIQIIVLNHMINNSYQNLTFSFLHNVFPWPIYRLFDDK